MARQIIRQPDGKWALWTTVADGFILFDASEQEVEDYIAREAEQDARDGVRDVIQTIRDGGNPYRQFRVEWDDACRQHKANHPTGHGEPWVSAKED